MRILNALLSAVLVLVLTGCCSPCGVGTRGFVGGVSMGPAEYQADGIRATIERTRGKSSLAPYVVRLGGPVRRMSQDAPLAALSTRLRVVEFLDDQGRVLDLGLDAAGREMDDGPWTPYFHFGARPPLALQGRGTSGPLSDAVFDTKRVRGNAEAWEMSRLACRQIELRSTELPMPFVQVAEGAWVAVRAFEQDRNRIKLNIWSFVSNTGDALPRMDPRPKHLNEYLVGGDTGRVGYDESRPPFLLGFELLDAHGCVLKRVQPHGAGLFTSEGLYAEINTTLEVEVDRPVAEINVVVATEVRVVEVPFESELRIWVRDDKGVIWNTDPRED